ncbi:hypothetical protein [Campylobacter pinnipediorum]|uniref:hypothetical protein n=1 Tax=Campylobacter pinnipediorum TaxID=1965231 RepID=UPI00084D40FF|nr:hypothetical protein [Campylobacter pinnipediorum]
MNFMTFDECGEMLRYYRYLELKNQNKVEDWMKTYNPEATYEKINKRLKEIWEKEFYSCVDSEVENILNEALDKRQNTKLSNSALSGIKEARTRIELLKDVINKIANIKCNDLKSAKAIINHLNEIVQSV